MSLRCPYCLTDLGVSAVNSSGSYQCSNCQSIIPRTYIEHRDTPKSMVGVVGFSGHGKTLYLTSLFSTLSKFSQYWPSFYYRSLDDYTHKILYEQVPLFEEGKLPESTPVNFPNPALIHYHEIPSFRNCYIGFYDTAGEVFTDASQIYRTGYFVAHSDTILFIISLLDCNQNRLDEEMTGLLDTYIRAVADNLSVNLKTRQRIVVIFTKADLLNGVIPAELSNSLKLGLNSWYLNSLSERVLELMDLSNAIEEWLLQEKQCNRFVNMLRDQFLEVRFTLVASITEKNEQGIFDSYRVLDPFLWLCSFTKNDFSFNSQNTDNQKKSWWQRIKEIWQ